MRPKSRGDIASAGMTSAPSGATIMKSRITANCKKASDATTNFWYGVNERLDFRMSVGGIVWRLANRGSMISDCVRTPAKEESTLRRLVRHVAESRQGHRHAAAIPELARYGVGRAYSGRTRRRAA